MRVDDRAQDDAKDDAPRRPVAVPARTALPPTYAPAPAHASAAGGPGAAGVHAGEHIRRIRQQMQALRTYFADEMARLEAELDDAILLCDGN
jgi:hypothetical protein